MYLVVYPKWANGPRIDGQNHPKFLILLARPKRFELLTPRFVVWCSIQLSYGRSARRP